MHIDGAIKSVSNALNTELILDHQNNLEVVTIDDCNCFKSGRDAPITLALTTLIRKSTFQKLTLSNTSVSTSLVLKVLHEFFSFQSTNHQELCFDHVKVMPDKTAEVISTPPPAVVGSKSMECELQPEIASVFPPSMSFQDLTLDVGDKEQNVVDLLDLFSHAQSLQVENMSLSVCASKQNSRAVVNLLNFVETQKLSLHFQFMSPRQIGLSEDTASSTLVDAVTDVIPTLGRLETKGIVTHLGFGFP